MNQPAQQHAVDDSPPPATAHVIAVQDDIVRIKLNPKVPDATRKPHLIKNEVIYITPNNEPEAHLKAEILRVYGEEADAQVFEDTDGIAIGDDVVQSGEMLSVELGPGLLGSVFDGLQNPLDSLGSEYGYYLPRGVDIPALNIKVEWNFNPSAKLGDLFHAGDTLGTVQEGAFTHRIMAPFDLQGAYELTWIQSGKCTVNDTVAKLKSQLNGEEINVGLRQRWPVRRPVTQYMLKEGNSERLYPNEPMITTLRLIDTFFPLAKGGTGCIPGPFGAGKTVLQNLIARYSDVDIVIVVACGERAGEVVETITEFPKLKDPVRDGPLMDRTIIICNTSSMPVAAREASIYTGITLGEYYRQMGFNVLLIADSTSRWAQAMRETSGRMEEIPGEEAFPAYLDSSIKNIYERAGVIRNREDILGSLTMIGTVSPAGGNFEEPVTQSTLATVKAFLGLSADRAYKRFYPAVDPEISWSRYLNQLQSWFEEHIDKNWVDRVHQVIELIKKGLEVEEMMQVTGEEGISLEDYVTYQRGKLVDMVYLQQDAFDQVDVSVTLERQQESFELLWKVITTDLPFIQLQQIREFFTEITHLYKNLNYTARNTQAYSDYMEQIESKLDQVWHQHGR